MNSVSPVSESLDQRLQQIDAFLAIGNLQHSRRNRTERNAAEKAARKAARPATEQKKRQDVRPEVLRVPAWKQYGWLVHGFSTRTGGVSRVYRPGAAGGDLNLGRTASDTAENVAKNRQLFLRKVLSGRSRSGKPQTVLLRQIHSGLVHEVDAAAGDQLIADAETLRCGDGMITAASGKLLSIQTADCFPIFVADVRQKIVAAFHAGWRGTLARIAERGVGQMRARFGSRPQDLTAAIGPGIGACCFEIGEEVRMEFRSQFAYAEELFSEVFDLDPVKEKYPLLFLTARAPGHSNLGPSIHLDLAEANRRQLLDAGLKPAAIHSLGNCTACNTKRFFSYRAEQGFTGRMMSVIGVAE